MQTSVRPGRIEAAERPRPAAVRALLGALAVAALLLLASRTHALEVIVGLPYGDHRIGHTAVRVRAPAPHGEVVYDFGRYAETWGFLKLMGEGIMRVWRGPKQVKRYLAKQTSYRDSVGFVIRTSDKDERRIFEYYEALLAKARWSKPHPDQHTRHRLARDYDGVAWQCTSVALAGLKAVWPRARWERLLDPRFNRGKGFTEKQRVYFFQQQDEQGLDETVMPLDVLVSLSFAHWRGDRDVREVRTYPQRNPSRRKPARTKQASKAKPTQGQGGTRKD